MDNNNLENNEVNNIDNNYNDSQNLISNESLNNNIDYNNGMYQYPTYNENSMQDDEDKPKNNLLKPILIILFIILILGLIFFLLFKFVIGTGKTNLDKIDVVNGSITPMFTTKEDNYLVQTFDDYIELSCSYKNKKVKLENCNKKISLKDNTSTIKVKVSKKTYTFKIVKNNDVSPVINDVTGNPNEWVKEVKLSVDALFKNEEAEESYSFDGGNTYQYSNEKTFNKNEKVTVVVRDKEENLSAPYEIEITKIDNEAPTIEVKSNTGKVAAFAIKDDKSGIIEWAVTENNEVPEQWSSIDLTYDTVIKYNALKDGSFYVWAKDSIGNYAYKKFTIGSNNGGQNGGNGGNNTNKETITITGVSGNSSKWTNNVTLTVNAKSSNSNAKLIYSFDGGKTFQSSNSKKITSNGDIQIVVKNQNTGVVSQVTNQKVQYVDSNPPSCGTISGSSKVWTKDSRTIQVECKDSGGSGCTQSSFKKTFETTTKTSNISIKDAAGNITLCPVNVYVDNSGPKITIDTNFIKNNKVYKFQVFVQDNESGVKIDSAKYKEKILKNGVDNIWHSKWDASLEIKKDGNIYTSYRYTKETGMYNYFTIKATDNLGNETEVNLSLKENDN